MKPLKTDRVTAGMRAKPPVYRTRMPRGQSAPYRLHGGPLSGAVVRLVTPNTLAFSVGDSGVGRYVNACWQLL